MFFFKTKNVKRAHHQNMSSLTDMKPSVSFLPLAHSLQVVSESQGILNMAMLGNRQVYCLTKSGLQVYAMNHFADFWATARCVIDSLVLQGCEGKMKRVVATGRDGRSVGGTSADIFFPPLTKNTFWGRVGQQSVGAWLAFDDWFCGAVQQKCVWCVFHII